MSHQYKLCSHPKWCRCGPGNPAARPAHSPGEGRSMYRCMHGNGSKWETGKLHVWSLPVSLQGRRTITCHSMSAPLSLISPYTCTQLSPTVTNCQSLSAFVQGPCESICRYKSKMTERSKEVFSCRHHPSVLSVGTRLNQSVQRQVSSVATSML